MDWSDWPELKETIGRAIDGDADALARIVAAPERPHVFLASLYRAAAKRLGWSMFGLDDRRPPYSAALTMMIGSLRRARAEIVKSIPLDGHDCDDFCADNGVCWVCGCEASVRATVGAAKDP